VVARRERAAKVARARIRRAVLADLTGLKGCTRSPGGAAGRSQGRQPLDRIMRK
jgi:hypothetical protein